MQIKAYSIDEFCRVHGPMSVRTFYNLLAAGKAPRLMEVGRRRMISEEAAAEWRQECEQRAAAEGISNTANEQAA